MENTWKGFPATRGPCGFMMPQKQRDDLPRITELYRRQEEKIQAERNHLMEMYPHRTLYQAPIWMKFSCYLNKFFDRSVLSRFTDKKLLGQKVTDFFNQ